MASVFLSYDRDDADKVRPFVRALEEAGHSVWWDLHVRGGAQFGKVIEEALKAADVVVVLWSKHSIESAWVKDEAAAGRDSGRLVPITIDGTPAPLGFRQFQTIDLSRGRRGKSNMGLLLEAVASLTPHSEDVSATRAPHPAPAPAHRNRLWIAVTFGAVLLVLLVSFGWWAWTARDRLPVVEIAAGDNSPRTQSAASDLFVKLGSLAQIGKGKWQLVDAGSARRRPDLLFRTTDTGSANNPRANVVLLDGKDSSLLWSREFSFPAGGEADLRQQMSLTVGRVLSCGLEARANGGLRRDLLKVFLDGCAQLAEVGNNSNPDRIVTAMRAVLDGQTRFIPAWGRLLLADIVTLDLARSNEQDETAAEQSIRRDVAQASKVAPNMPEIVLAQVHLLPPSAYGQALDLLAKAKASAPDNPEINVDQAYAFLRVGRLSDAVESARRAAELDPLSPAAKTQFIMTLAYAGQVETARRELERAEKVLAGTGALRDAQFAFHFRFGSPKIAAQLASIPGAEPYLQARADPSPANVEALLAQLRQLEAKPDPGAVGYAVQALGEFHRTDDVFRWLRLMPADTITSGTEVLFRPALADVRRDPRFIGIAKELGLLDYWRQSGEWPDFCSDPTLPYDCKKEAAKLT